VELNPHADWIAKEEEKLQENAEDGIAGVNLPTMLDP